MPSVWKPSITYTDVLQHSAKGTTWKDHKYIKKIGDTYIYAKKAAIAERNSKNARKDFEKYEILGGGTINRDANKRIEKRIIDRRDGAPTKYYDNKNSLEYYQERAASTFLQSERNARYAQIYKKQAKKALSSIPKEMINDGKKLYNSILSKIKSMR